MVRCGEKIFATLVDSGLARSSYWMKRALRPPENVRANAAWRRCGNRQPKETTMNPMSRLMFQGRCPEKKPFPAGGQGGAA